VVVEVREEDVCYHLIRRLEATATAEPGLPFQRVGPHLLVETGVSRTSFKQRANRHVSSMHSNRGDDRDRGDIGGRSRGVALVHASRAADIGAREANDRICRRRS
jgi:hypothetical protein